MRTLMHTHTGRTVWACGIASHRVAQYWAPELVRGEDGEEVMYNRQVDTWSIGVIAYLVLTGRFPFNAPTEDELFVLIRGATYGEGCGARAPKPPPPPCSDARDRLGRACPAPRFAALTACCRRGACCPSRSATLSRSC